MKLSPQQRDAFAAAVQQAAASAPAHQVVKNLYMALQDAIDLRKPICIQSGRCCHFESFGHRLFITTMEMGTFLHDQQRLGRFSGHGSECPFQLNQLCSVHSIRPLGCRIFFCDQTATDWQQEQYARFHDHLKRLHEELKIPYFYVEWRQALVAIGLADVVSPKGL